MIRRLCIVFLFCATGGFALSAAESAGPVAQSIRAVIDEYENLVRANTQKIIAAKTEEEKDKYRATVPTVAPYATRVLKIVQDHAADPESGRGVSWLVTQAAGFPEGQEALKMLGTTHTSSAGIAEAVKALEYHPLAMAEPILLAVREKNPNATEKAAATYALGVQYFRLFESASALPEECCGNGAVAAPAPAGLTKEAEATKAKAMDYFQDVVANYPGAAIQGFPLGDQSSRMMFELTNLSVGSEVPDIEGKELDGQAFKLSDYRGKHVVLMFWGGWCHACHGVLPLVNQFATDMKDKPVAVLGINTDIPEEARVAYQTYKVNFRNWSDAATGGPITTLFNLRNFPTLYLIDPKGIIVLKNTSIDAVREKLKGL